MIRILSSKIPLITKDKGLHKKDFPENREKNSLLISANRSLMTSTIIFVEVPTLCMTFSAWLHLFVLLRYSKMIWSFLWSSEMTASCAWPIFTAYSFKLPMISLCSSFSVSKYSTLCANFSLGWGHVNSLKARFYFECSCTAPLTWFVFYNVRTLNFYLLSKIGRLDFDWLSLLWMDCQCD